MCPHRLCELCSRCCSPHHFLINFSITLFPLGHGQFLDPPSSLVFWLSPLTPLTSSCLVRPYEWEMQHEPLLTLTTTLHQKVTAQDGQGR